MSYYENGNAKYFRFRDLNGSNYNVVGVADIPYDFYSIIPEPYKMAYMEMWRSRLWLSGKVPGIHNYLLSSGIAGTIASIMANRIVGENGKFDGKREANQALEEWSKKDDFKNKISSHAYLMSGTGQSLFKLNVINSRNKKTSYCTEVLSGDSFLCKMIGNEIEKCTVFSNFYQDTTGNNRSDYYLLEIREYDENDKPIGYYEVVENKSIYTEGAYKLKESHKYNYSNIRELGNDAIKDIANKLGIDERDLVFKKELPFKLGLGVAVSKNSYIHPRFVNYNIGCSDISKISEDTLVTYELFTSLLSNEGSVTIPVVMLPQRLYNPRIDRGAQFIPLDERFSNESQGALPGQLGYAVVNNRSRKIDGTYITYVESEDPESQEPKLIQFNMRMDDIDKGIQRTVLNIANNLEISPMILDTRLRGSSQYKNKNEINLDENLTGNTISNKRNMIKNAVNYIVDEVLLFLGYNPKDSDYMFTSAIPDDERNLTETLILQIQNGLVSTEVARKRLYNSMTREEFDNMVSEIDKEQKEKEEKELKKVLEEKTNNNDKMAKKNENLHKGKVGNANINTNISN